MYRTAIYASTCIMAVTRNCRPINIINISGYNIYIPGGVYILIMPTRSKMIKQHKSTTKDPTVFIIIIIINFIKPLTRLNIIIYFTTEDLNNKVN